ncbi:MAG: ATP--guanido phosphotransferase [Planctomycetes bacterium SM23_25]|nr:MAG: ATP--guanido phosphotransferase [Planctomycetes bacterium SM23_25]
MRLDKIILSPSPWLQPGGPSDDIVLSTRVRLARNIAGRPFLNRLKPDEQEDLEAYLKHAVLAALKPDRYTWFELEDMPQIDRQCLVERHLISRELAAGEGQRGVAVGPKQRIAIMANEEDHLRIQVYSPGLQLQDAWQEADAIDDRLESKVTYTFSPKLGYLTACPTNIGTGLRASVMLHLPALVLTRQIEKVFNAVARLRLAVRGLYGEGTQATGDIYQISNQASLGRTEQDILKTLGSVISQIIAYEKEAREALAAESPTPLDDRVLRSWAILTHARIISSEETLALLSAVRLGIHLRRLKDVDMATINELFLMTRRGHIQKIRGAELGESERDVARADYIRKRLGAN